MQKARKRLTREERSPAEIFAASARIVGELGHSDTSISRVVEAAGMAQGTFYLYFDSRQSLFDELLPYTGRRMLDFIRSRTPQSAGFFENEERAFRAFFEYLKVNPGFIRILNEAEAAAPEDARLPMDGAGPSRVRSRRIARGVSA